MRNYPRVNVQIVARLAVCGTIVGCVGESITQPGIPTLPTSAISYVKGFPDASIVAIGGTQQLSATGITLAGESITAFDSVVYQYRTLSDSVRLRLSNTGLVTGLSSTGTNPVLVNVIAFKGSSIRGDQVVVQVTPTAASGLQLSVQPIPPDSARLASGTTKTIVPTLRDPTTGVSVSNPAVKYTVKGSDSARVDVFRGTVRYIPDFANLNDFVVVNAPPTTNSRINPNQIVALAGEGSAWIYATISAYGTILRDSVRYTFTYPFAQTISTVKDNLALQNIYANQMVTLAPGATVSFQNGVSSADPLTVAYSFDNPAGASAASPASVDGGSVGNVTPLTGGQTSRRRFLSPGTYRWTMTAAGGPAPWPGQTLSGTIVIK